MTMQSNITSAINFSPDIPEFGCVPIGYSYKLFIKLTNVSPMPEKLKVSCEPVDGETNPLRFNYLPLLLAAGMHKTLMFEFDAVHEKTSKYNLYVTTANKKLFRQLEIHVLSEPRFRTLTNGLRVLNKKAYSDNVVVASVFSCEENTSMAQSMFSTAMMADEDLEVLNSCFLQIKTNYFDMISRIQDLYMMPMVENVYFDPAQNRLCLDSELSRVC